MVDKKLKDVICQKGRELEGVLPNFYGKIVLNYNNGVFMVANVEQSLIPQPVKNKKRGEP